MSDYERGEATYVHVRYRLPVPANAIELDKAVQAAAKERAGELGISRSELPDDALAVNVTDDAVLISWIREAAS